MSRLQNKINMGYVPTPPSVVHRVRGFLSFSGPTHAVDPCCGQGEALHLLVDGLPVKTFGVELHTGRANQAARLLDRVLNCSYEEVRISQDDDGCELLWLNPPYDDDQKAGRMELTFLRDTTDWLRPGGVLVYIIRQPHLTQHMARRLSTNFRDLAVYAFPEQDYQAFQQIVVMGIKRAQPELDSEALKMLLNAANITLPDLPAEPDRSYVVLTRPDDMPWRFRSRDVPIADVLAEADRRGVLSTPWWPDLMAPQNLAHTRPLVPLRLGHLAMFIAAGMLDNLQLDTHLLIKGYTRKQAREVASESDGDTLTTTTVEEFVTLITTLDLQTGQITHISDPARLMAFVERWREPLTQAIVQTYQPIYDMEVAPEHKAALSHLLQHKRLPGRRASGLLPAQEAVAVAAAKSILANGSATLVMATGTGKTPVSLAVARLLQLAKKGAITL